MTRIVVPLLLLLSLLLGGSGQRVFPPLLIALAGVLVLAWSSTGQDRGDRTKWPLLLICGAAILLVILQLVPLPPMVWHALPGRGFVASGDALLGLEAAWRPLTLDPAATMGVLGFLAAPVAIIVAGTRKGVSRWLCAAAIVGAAALGAVMGLAQRADILPRFYPFSSTGPTGQFANTNHLAALMVAALPFLASMVVRAERDGRKMAVRALAVLVSLLFAAVTVLTGSLAMIALLLPVGGACLLLIFRKPVSRGMMLGAFAISAVAIVLVFALGVGADVSMSTRGLIWRQSRGLVDYLWTGSGFGTFQALYQTIIDPMRADMFIVNHAHNDFLELTIEGGIPAIILMILTLGWLGRAVVRAWRADAARDPFAQAASIAAAVLIAHSAVEFPLRTPALAAVFAVCLLMLATDRPLPAATEEDALRPTRHRRVR